MNSIKSIKWSKFENYVWLSEGKSENFLTMYELAKRTSPHNVLISHANNSPQCIYITMFQCYTLLTCLFVNRFIFFKAAKASG